MTRLDLTPAATQIVTLIRSVPDDQLKAPTPCTEATLGDLIEHVRGCAFAFRNAARKGGGDVANQGAVLDMTQLPGDWRRSVPRDVEALAEAWNDEAAWTGMTRAGGMDMPAEVTGLVALDELTLHGWDIARALDIAYEPDPAAVPALFEFVQHAPAGLFKPPVPVPDDAPLFDRVLGLAGRDPAWSPPQ